MAGDFKLSNFLLDSPESRKGNTLFSVLNSVLLPASSNINEEKRVIKKIKVKHNALRDSVLSFRDLTLYFDESGIAETEEYNKSIIEIEQMYRPGCFTFIEDDSKSQAKDDITVIEEELDKARKELEIEEEKIEEQSSKRGRKGKGK